MFFLKPKNFVLILKNFRKTKNERCFIKRSLYGMGFTKLKSYIPHTWKTDNLNIRIVFVAQKENKKWLIKADGNSKRGQFTANFYKLFNGKFDFIPIGYNLDDGVFFYDIKEYIPHYTFLEYKSVMRKNVDVYLQQAIYILNSFNAFKIIHCDLEGHNIIFDKRSKKMIIVDFDSWHSDLFQNQSSKTPPKWDIYKKGGLNVFFFSYCFVRIFKKLQLPDLNNNHYFNELENMIGKNIYMY